MILGLAGKAGSGKDTVADFLVEKHGFTKLSFAKNLKEMCKVIFDLKDWHVYDEKGKETPFENPVVLNPHHLIGIDEWIRSKTPSVKVSKNGLSSSIINYWEIGQASFASPRELLQFVGTEICREMYSKSYHIDVVHSQIDKGNFVIADARFANEREEIKNWNGFRIKIIDPDQEECGNTGIQGHASETEMDGDDFDTIFMNDKSQGLQVLEVKVDQVLKDLKEQVFNRNKD